MSTVLITGANGSLGISVTARMVEDKHRIIATVGSHGPGMLPESPKLITREVDLNNEEQTREFIEGITSKYPDLDAAVLLVGGFAMGKLEDTDIESFNRMLNLNFHTAFLVVKSLLPFFKRRGKGGQFILIGTRPGLEPKLGTPFFAYALSKSLVFDLADIINAEGEKQGITATVIVPSTIDTPNNRKDMPDADFSSWVQPQNIAEAISFALSDTGKMLRQTVIKIYNRS